jgi:hypothetical protein
MQDAVAMEELGVPVAVIVTEAFVREAQVQAEALGMRELAPVVIAHPLSTLTDEQIAARAAEAVPQVRNVLRGR